ncbi:hypothetical protein ACWHAM_02980 [Paenibacillus terrae]
MFSSLLIVISSASFVLFLLWGIVSLFKRTKKAKWNFLISLLSLVILFIATPADQSKPASEKALAQAQADVSSKVSNEDVESTPSYSEVDKKNALQIESLINKYENEMTPYEHQGNGVFDMMKADKVDDSAICKEIQRVNEKYKETIKKINSIKIPDGLHNDLKYDLENMLRSANGYYTSRFIAYEHLFKYIKESDETHIDTVIQELTNAKDFSKEYKMYVHMLFTKTGLPDELKNKE